MTSETIEILKNWKENSKSLFAVEWLELSVHLNAIWKYDN